MRIAELFGLFGALGGGSGEGKSDTVGFGLWGRELVHCDNWLPPNGMETLNMILAGLPFGFTCKPPDKEGVFCDKGVHFEVST